MAESVLSDWYTPEPFNPDLDPARVAVTVYCADEQEGESQLLPSSPADDILGSNKDLITGWGTYVHARTMQLMGIYAQDKSREDLAKEAFPPIEKKKMEQLMDAGDALAKQFLSSTYYHKEIEPFLSTTRAEVHLFLHPHDEQNTDLVVEGQIDILIKKPDGYDILDFKTDKTRTKDGHKQQVALYRDALREITGCTKIRTAIVYLRDPEHVVYWV